MLAAGATMTSGNEFASPLTNATVDASLLKLKLPSEAPDAGLSAVNCAPDGFSLNSRELVFSSPEKKIPPGVHAMSEGCSSKPSVTDLGAPPAADTIAMRELEKKNHGFAIALSNAICDPSGDHFGFESGPC